MKTDKRNPAVHASTVTPAADTMTAMVQDEYGEAEDVLRLEQIDRPQIVDGQVLVRVHAAGLDQGVWHAMAGLPYPIRLAGYGLRTPNNRVPGTDVAGRVESVGATVTGLRVGDEVFGVARGSFALYASPQRTSSYSSRSGSPSSRRPPFPSPRARPCRAFVTAAESDPDNTYW